jgi:hypothetical protein
VGPIQQPELEDRLPVRIIVVSGSLVMLRHDAQYHVYLFLMLWSRDVRNQQLLDLVREDRMNCCVMNHDDYRLCAVIFRYFGASVPVFAADRKYQAYIA